MPAYELSSAAEDDLRDIVTYTSKTWRTAQARQYTRGLREGAENLANSQGVYKELHDLYPRLRMCRCQHHYIFGVMREGVPMLVVAIFHERMDTMTRLRNRLG